MFKFTCSECGSGDVNSKCWTNPNTNKINNYINKNETKDNWCNKCGEHVTLRSRETLDMTNIEKLQKAEELINEVWEELVPDVAPTTVTEDEYFDTVNATGERIVSDIQDMITFVIDKA